MIVDPPVGVLQQVTPVARLLRADNPGPMTLSGTNSYLLSARPDGPFVVVDPGPDDAAHQARLAAAGPVELIVVTHRHADHTGGSARLHALTGAPVRAFDRAFCLVGQPLRDDEVIEAAGLSIRVIATPGHTADSVSFEIVDDGPAGLVLTGDTLLGAGTTVLAEPDGDLGAYLASLRRLSGFGPSTVLPAHGPVRDDLSALARQYLAHREQRLAQIRAAVDRLGDAASAAAVTDEVYSGIDPAVRPAAEQSVHAQLRYLAIQGETTGP